jgi:hypothetical protein
VNRFEQLRPAGRSPGVYRSTPGLLPATVVATLRLGGLTVWPIDAAASTDKASFLQACARGLSLPAWFGHNWDAFADSLADLPVPASGGAIVLSGAQTFAAADPRGVATALDVLSHACLRPDGAPLWVVVITPDERELAAFGLASL